MFLLRSGACRAVLAWMVVLTFASFATAAGPEKLDFSELNKLPVFHRGRAMPYQSFARLAVDVVSGSENPTLAIHDVGHDEGVDISTAEVLFPDKKPRKFAAEELVFSWMVESDKWDDVPFLEAKNVDLRSLLGVELKDSKGAHLKYVSPNQVRESLDFQNFLQDLAQKRRAAPMNGEELELTDLETEAEGLWQSIRLYQRITLSPALDPTVHQGYRERGEQLFETWQQLAAGLQVIGESGTDPKFAEHLAKCLQSLQMLAGHMEQQSVLFSEADQATGTLAVNAEGLARSLRAMQKRMDEKQQADKPAGEAGAAAEDSAAKDSAAKGARLVLFIISEVESLAKQAREMQQGLLQNDEWLRVVPALNPLALEANRDTSNPHQPWMDLQSLLDASDSMLAGYPLREVKKVRDSFKQMSKIYQDRATSGRAANFTSASRAFTNSMRELGEAVEPIRAELPVKELDQELLEYTAYPPEGERLAAEIAYNRIDPFKWSWIVSLTALICFSLSFGVMRKPMFWLGMTVLISSLLWTTAGFAIRSYITSWAPVTNMWETVVYVPFVATALGAWFTLLPITWPGIRAAFRMSAIPGSWEASRLTDDQEILMGKDSWFIANLIMQVPRLALSVGIFMILAMVPYAAGDRTIINLLPAADVNNGGYSGNDFLTWGVGLCVLAASVWYVPRVLLTFALSLVTVPMAHMYRQDEAAPVMPQVYARWPFAICAAAVGFFSTYVAWYSPVLDEGFSPLQPVLRDNFWLLIHVLTIVSSYGAGALAWGLGNIALFYYLFGKYQQPAVSGHFSGGHRPASDDFVSTVTRRPPAECATLANYTYKVVQVAVLLLITGTILGGLWADVSWGRFWGWDPKEVWALISGLVYLAILHGRYSGWFGNFGMAVGAVLGASAIIFSWYGVNFYLGVGLHAYGFGSGGQFEVGLAVLANWVFVALASARYLWETSEANAVTVSHDGSQTVEESEEAAV